MMKKVYLLWADYVSKELLVLASLTKFENNYILEFDEDLGKAINDGCILPFEHNEKQIVFNKLPNFFVQRMLSKETIKQFNIKCDLNDEFSILTCNNGRKNSDNFYILNEEKYQIFKNGKQKVKL